MKYALLVVALMAVLPLVGWLRRNPQHTTKVWIVMGVFPFVVSTGPHPLYIALISWAQWPGYVKGAELSAIDILALAIYLSQARARHPLPFQFSMALYFIAILFSALPAGVPIASLFYAWQLARMFLVYAVVTKACSDDRVAPALLTGMAIGIWLAAGMAAWQRIGQGVFQPGGTVGDKNLLGLMAHFVGLPWFALLLAGQRGQVPYLAPLGSVITAVLTVSRAALGLTAVGMVLVFMLSILRKWTRRKAIIALLSAVVLLALLPIALSSLESRFSSEPPPSDYDERAAFQRAAEMILFDHPMGVGANNYVVIANTGGYNERAKVAAITGSLSTNVHNAYLLAAAETGYFGVLTLVLLLLRPLTVAFHCGWRNRGDRRGDLLLGLGTTLLIVYIHSFFEWIFFSFQAQYLFAMTAGLIAGLAQQLGYWERAQTYGSRLVPRAIRSKQES